MKNLIKTILDKTNTKTKLNLIVSGGESPRVLFRKLSKLKDNLKKINFYLADERLTNKKNFSNLTNLLKEINRGKIKIKIISPTNKKIFLKNFKKNYLISILGIGEDGHFASIFGTSKKFNLLTNRKYKPNIYLTDKIGKPFCKRVTVNLPAILGSNKIFIILNNLRKKNIIRKALKEKDSKKYPIYLLLKHAKKKLSFFDAKKLIQIKSF
tara:strand:- start:32 stop:664 length:633 start_codon:yes stop_codon:yes gene_type:complete